MKSSIEIPINVFTELSYNASFFTDNIDNFKEIGRTLVV